MASPAATTDLDFRLIFTRPSSASLGLTDSSQVDMLSAHYKSVNFGAAVVNTVSCSTLNLGRYLVHVVGGNRDKNGTSLSKGGTSVTLSNSGFFCEQRIRPFQPRGRRSSFETGTRTVRLD
jgi:hypothetical protein